GGFHLGTAIDLVHQEDLQTISVLKSLAHADLARALVVVPAVIHEGDAAVDGLTDELNRFALGNRWLADVPTTQADGGDAFACAAEGAVDHPVLPAFRPETV